MLERSFALARKYGLNAFANTILAVPGTTYQDDYKSVMFSRKLNPACPTFSIFSPFPGTDLTKYAIDIGVLDPEFDYNEVSAWDRSVLNSYSADERMRQTNLAFLGALICKVPRFMLPVMDFLVKQPWTPMYRLVGSLVFTYLMGTRVFPGAQPRSARGVLKAVIRSMQYLLVFNQKAKIDTPTESALSSK
jgi:hypothetical protein